jgi:ABC-type transport system involved in multi-copper enzyme maturation permease subunit
MSRSQKWRLGLGPVFVYEWVTAARRWQAYAVRSVFLLLVLLALTVIWVNNPLYSYRIPIAQLAYMGQQYFLALTVTQLAAVLLAAPAVTAGAISLDRARGTLQHMLLTDLSSAEIVLGKLAARLVPVMILIACTLPVMEMVSLLGGVEPMAILGAFVVTLGVAALGCSLAFFLSLWQGKTHVALLSTYAIWCVWLAIAPVLDLLGFTASPARRSNPFYLALAPLGWAGGVVWRDYYWFLGACCAISAVLIAVAVLGLRRVGTRDRSAGPTVQRRVPRGRLARLLTRNVPWLTPSLDRNPVLWREWHRGNASGWGRVIMALAVILSMTLTVLAILSQSRDAATIASGFQVSICLLCLSVVASTSLAEERAHGSLELLLSTPLSCGQIVLGKWLGTFRVVPLLAILPWLTIAVIAYIQDERSWSTQCLFVAYMLAAGAAITSLGLAMATWFSRPGRAIGTTIAVYLILAVGSMGTTMMKFGRRGEGLAMASPFYWTHLTTRAVLDYHFQWFPFSDWAYFWAALSAVASIGLLLWIMAGFERHLGRTEGLAAQIGQPSRWMRIATTVYFSVAAAFFGTAIFFDVSWELIFAFTGAYFSVGKVLLSLRAARRLAIDRRRQRGSMTASLFSRRSALAIIAARWLGSYRIVVPMVLLPAIYVLLKRGPSFIAMPQLPVVVAFMLLQNAAVVSFGVAMATWFTRRGHAVFLTLLFCTFIEGAGLLAAQRIELDSPSRGFYLSSLHVGDKTSFEIALASTTSDDDLMVAVSHWSAGYGVAAFLLLVAAIATFNRSSAGSILESARPIIVTERGSH